MKKAVIFAMAAALTLSLAACGNRDNKNANNSGSTNKDQVENGGANNNGTGSNSGNGITNGSTSSDNGTTANNNDGATGNNGSAGSGGMGSNAGTGNSSNAGSSIGNDVRRGLDDVGDAIGDVLDGGRAAVNDAARTTSFQQMLDSARVYDVDGSEGGARGY